MATEIATLQGERVTVDDAALAQFRSTIHGEVLRPGDQGYSDRPIYNAMHKRRPALIVRCAGTADVVDAVKFAREQANAAEATDKKLGKEVFDFLFGP